MISLSLKAVTFFTLTSHTALTQHVLMYFAMLGYPLQYSWASLVAQLVKNPPAMQKTWV